MREMENTGNCPLENIGFYLVIIVKPRSPLFMRFSGFFFVFVALLWL